jgi:hypothetical protein
VAELLVQVASPEVVGSFSFVELLPRRSPAKFRRLGGQCGVARGRGELERGGEQAGVEKSSRGGLLL